MRKINNEKKDTEKYKTRKLRTSKRKTNKRTNERLAKRHRTSECVDDDLRGRHAGREVVERLPFALHPVPARRRDPQNENQKKGKAENNEFA
jgi:hypothetical protein